MGVLEKKLLFPKSIFDAWVLADGVGARERKGRERKGKDGKGRERKGKEGKGRERMGNG